MGFFVWVFGLLGDFICFSSGKNWISSELLAVLMSCGCKERAPLDAGQAAGTRDGRDDKGAALAHPAGDGFSRS